MCGIAGAWSFDPRKAAEYSRLMAGALVHRGPDGAGEWADSSVGLAFNHRRLVIIDPTECGRQPATSLSGRWIICFNGEIYNYEEIRRDLIQHGIHPRGRSDTQVLLEAIDLWGLEATMSRIYGMFAFAAWDSKEQRLYLLRDRAGEKPLYYGLSNGCLFFASELKAFQAAGIPLEVSRDVLALFLRLNYIPAPHSIFKEVLKLPPGFMACFTKEALKLAALPVVHGERDCDDGYILRQYWSVKTVAENGQKNLFRGSASDARIEVDRLLRQIIGEQMLADVPVGAFLSGGIDSSLIVSIMQSMSSAPVRTFTIGYSESSHNEAPMASAISQHLGCEHQEFFFGPSDALAIIPTLPTVYDEPFADVTQLPACLLAQLARTKVSVALSGDGGDEMFAGYPRYEFSARLWNSMRLIPRPIRAAIGRFGTWLGPARWNVIGQLLTSLTANLKWKRLGHRIDRLSHLLISESFEQLYLFLCSQWLNPSSMVIGGREALCAMSQPDLGIDIEDSVRRLMYVDALNYLPGDILATLDRASMAASLETRSPFVDVRLMEYAWTLPTNFLTGGKSGKLILRELLAKYIPKHLFDRPKVGFGVPIGRWLRTELREWSEEMLSEDRLKREGFLLAKPVRDAWGKHLSGERELDQSLWGVLMWQAWSEQWISAVKTPFDTVLNESRSVIY